MKEIASSYSKEVMIEKSAPGGFSFADHLNYSDTLNLNNSENWDIIVTQENTYVAAYETEVILSSLEDLKPLIEATGASNYLFKTWAY